MQIRAVVPVNKSLFRHQWRSWQADTDFSRRRRRLPLTAEADLTKKVCFFFFFFGRLCLRMRCSVASVSQDPHSYAVLTGKLK